MTAVTDRQCDMYDKRNGPDVTIGVDLSPSGSSESSGEHELPLSLSRFVAERSLPSVVRVLAGCYGNVSVNNDNELYVHSTSQHTAVIAETLGSRTATGRSTRTRRSTTTADQTLSLPLDYDGRCD